MNKMPSYLETYKKRPGTSNHGKEFEYLMCAFYCLQLIDCKEISDFEIFTNPEAGEDFDDVVLKVKLIDESAKLVFLQLKHSENNPKSVTLNALTSHTGNFSLIKYQQTYSKIQVDSFRNTYDKGIFDAYMILYTNRIAAFGNDSELMLQTEKCQIKENKTDPIASLLNTNEKGNGIFKIEITTANTPTSIDFENFFKHFYIYTNQKNHQNIKNAIHEVLLKKFSCDVGNAFINFFKKWWERNFIFTKEDVIMKLSELVFSPSIKTISDEKFTDNSKLLKEAIMMFDVTIIEGRVDGDIEEKIWNEPPHDLSHKLTVVKIIQKFALTERNISTNTQLTSEEINKSLWYLDKIPFIIEINESNKNQIQSAILFLERNGIKKKLILKGDCKKINLSKDWKVLKNLFDVKEEKEEVYRSVIERFQVSFESEKEISLENLFDSDEENAKFIDVSALLYISSGDFSCIKRKKENLPLEYVPRAVTSVFLDITKLLKKSVLQENLLIINCNNKVNFVTNIIHQRNINVMDCSRYLQLKDSKPSMEEIVIMAKNDECTLQQFRKICSKSGGNVHLLKIIDEECFMLIASQGNREELRQFALSKSPKIEETNIHNVFDGPLNFISAEPGMGKSTTMKYLKNETPSDYWTIFIELKNYNSIFKRKVITKDILKTFLNSTEKKTESFVHKMKEIFVRKKKVIFFLDGFDEMEHDCMDKALNFIKEISLRGFRVWVSTRENFQEKVEEQLNIFPLQIVELNKIQQEEYIYIRLKEQYEYDEIKKIVEKISKSVSISNNNKFLGIPLQLYIITEILINNKPSNLEIDEKMFVLTNLYKTFFQGIIKHVLKKKGLADDDLGEEISMSELDKYTIPALKVCLMEGHFQRLNLNPRQICTSDRFLLSIKEKGDPYGIIKQIDINGKAIYGHQTYVEYFACYFLSKNFDKVQHIKQELFYNSYTNLRLLLDLELAAGSPLHLSVIYGNVEFMKECIEKYQINKDEANRSPLHLVCSYVNRYLHLAKRRNYYMEPRFLQKKENSSLQQIIMKLVELCPIMEKDELYQWNPIEYALMSRCLFPIEAMLHVLGMILPRPQQYDEILNFVLKTFDESTLLYYASKLAYHNLLITMLKKNPLLIEKIKYKWDRLSILHVVIKGNVEDIQTLKILLEFVNKINTLRTLQGETVLHFAVEYANMEVVKQLIQKGADVNCVTNDGKNVLHTASRKGHYELVAFLLKCGAELDTKDANGKTPLYYACSNKNYNVVKKLIENGADVNCITNTGETVLHKAARAGDLKLIEYLLNVDADPNIKNYQGKTALHVAAKQGYNNVVKLLIQKGANCHIIANDGSTLLHEASGLGNCELISYLLSCGIDPDKENCDKKTALYLAAKYGNKDMVTILLQKSVIFLNSIGNKDEETILHLASIKGDCELISYLLNFKIDPNKRNSHGRTALYIAAVNGNNDVVKFLIEKGAKVDCITNDGQSVLHAAAKKGSSELISYLLNYNINLNLKDNHGRTALYCAILNGNKSAVKVLIQKGADVNCIAQNGETVLHQAARRKDPEIMTCILECDINLNVKNNRGETALYTATWESNISVVHLLLEKGADINVVTKKGISLLDIARSKNNKIILNLLSHYSLEETEL